MYQDLYHPHSHLTPALFQNSGVCSPCSELGRVGHSEASSQGVPAGFPLSRGSLSSPHLSSGSHSSQRDPGTGCSPPSELKLSLLPPLRVGVGSRPLPTLPSVTHRVLDELLPVVRGGSSTFRGLPRGCSRLLLPLLGLLWVLRVYQTLLSPLSPPPDGRRSESDLLWMSRPTFGVVHLTFGGFS